MKPGPAARRAALAAAGWSAGVGAAILTALYVMLDGSRRDFRVPLHFSADSLEYLMQVKGTIERGWWWVHPRLSAPSAFVQLAYPSNTNVDQALVWIVHWFTRDPGLCLNVTWMIAVALSGVIAMSMFVDLGVSRVAAAVTAVLYALSPYALYRNIEHFSLVTYLVPIPCAAALLVASGRIAALPKRRQWIFIAGCALIGLNYTYYAFFGVFVLLVATAISMAGDRRGRAWRRGAMLAGVICVATVVNLAPSWIVWHRDGQSLIIPDKTAAESEVYGMKIRQLVSPVLDQSLPPLKNWNDLETRAHFPLETENSTSRLGLIATAGFLTLVAVLLLPGAANWIRDPLLAISASRLTLALVLLGTIGGFGSLFSLLISPEIRSYNRVYPFIAFCCWLVVGLVLDARRPASRWVAAAVLLTIGLYDQGHAAAPLNRAYDAIRDEHASLGAFVQALERKLPRASMVFQLPLTTYLNDRGEERMKPYDEIKPYLASSTIHWSYPALDNSVVRWQHAVARLPPAAMTSALARAGFSAIVIDKNGYADSGASILSAIAPDPVAVLASSTRYVAIDLGRSVQTPMTAPPVWAAGFLPATTHIPACASPAEANLDSVDGIKLPPARPVTIDRRGDVVFRGWALDSSKQDPAGDVDVAIDDRLLATFYGVDRPDIATRYGNPTDRFSGFVTTLPASQLNDGSHAVVVRVLSADRRCVSQTAAVTIVK